MRNPYKSTDTRTPDEILLEGSYYSRLISYRIFQSAVLPIISEKDSEKNLKIYDDYQLPSGIRSEIKKIEDSIEMKLNVYSITLAALLGKLPGNYLITGDWFGGANFFSKQVLKYTVPATLFGSFLIKQYLQFIGLIDLEDIMFSDFKDPRISAYRKRLIETYPKYAGYRYRYTKEVQDFDKVTLFKENFTDVVTAKEVKELGSEITQSHGEYLEYRNEDSSLS